MRAIQFKEYGSPDVLKLLELEQGEVGKQDLRVRMLAAGVAPVDTKIRAGLLQAQLPIALPKIPGRDGVGIVEAIGSEVRRFSVGDTVCVMADMLSGGTSAEVIVVAEQRAVLKPVNLSRHEAAALLQPGISAWIPVVQVAAIQPGMKVLVHSGSGAVGSLMVQLAAHLGAEVTSTCRAANVDYVLGLGAQHAIAYDHGDFGTLRDQDVVFDLVGGATHERSYPVLKKGGHLVWLMAGPIVDRADEFGVRVTRAMISDQQSVLQAVADLAQQGVLRPRVSEVRPLADAAGAHAALERGQITRGRLVLDI
ncbi:NADP-dependent oxidoreductase [Herbaspirillum lusitanum]|uniref:NADP-dependent oxidoreductase n=1 Tax=Herbaspirillum lusitanum TaxID=213312 RepID=A0ABW9A5B1_9BURK